MDVTVDAEGFADESTVEGQLQVDPVPVVLGSPAVNFFRRIGRVTGLVVDHPPLAGVLVPVDPVDSTGDRETSGGCVQDHAALAD